MQAVEMWFRSICFNCFRWRILQEKFFGSMREWQLTLCKEKYMTKIRVRTTWNWGIFNSKRFASEYPYAWSRSKLPWHLVYAKRNICVMWEIDNATTSYMYHSQIPDLKLHFSVETIDYQHLYSLNLFSISCASVCISSSVMGFMLSH